MVRTIPKLQGLPSGPIRFSVIRGSDLTPGEVEKADRFLGLLQRSRFKASARDLASELARVARCEPSYFRNLLLGYFDRINKPEQTEMEGVIGAIRYGAAQCAGLEGQEPSATEAAAKSAKAVHPEPKPRAPDRKKPADDGPNQPAIPAWTLPQGKELDDLLCIPRTEVEGRIREVFERIEKRLGFKQLADVANLTGLGEYDRIRCGDDLLSRSFMEGGIFRKIGFRDREISEIWHLQTLERVARDRESERRRGPYFKAGLLVRYWRLHAGLDHMEVRSELLTRFKFQDYSGVEMGWKSCRDPRVLDFLERRLGIPAQGRPSFLLYLTNIYDEVDKIRRPFSPRGLATDFPNEEWDLPYIHRSREEIRESIKRIVVDALKKSGLTRAGFAKSVGCSPRKLDAAMYHGNLSADSLIHFITCLRADGREKDAVDLRMLRAAAEVVYYPASRENALRGAALLFRFARSLIPIFSEEVIFKLLKWEGALNVYKECERGTARMPPDLLRRFALLMFEKGIFNKKQETSFIRRIESIYMALGV